MGKWILEYRNIEKPDHSVNTFNQKYQILFLFKPVILLIQYYMILRIFLTHTIGFSVVSAKLANNRNSDVEKL